MKDIEKASIKSFLNHRHRQQIHLPFVPKVNKPITIQKINGTNKLFDLTQFNGAY